MIRLSVKPTYIAVVLLVIIVISGITSYEYEVFLGSKIRPFNKNTYLLNNNETTKELKLEKKIDMPQKNTEEPTNSSAPDIHETSISTITSAQNHKPVSEHFHLSKSEVAQLNKALRNATKRMTVLIWEPMYGRKEDISVNKTECGACHFTYNKSEVSKSATKAVVFHFTSRLKTMPPNRRSDQFYVWWTKECTRSVRFVRGRKLNEYDAGFFNLTMSYRQNSDVYDSYSTAAIIFKTLKDRGSGNMSKDLDELIDGKNQTALWVVSNCGTTKGAKQRLNLTNDLIKAGLNLDRGGGCFPKGKKVPRKRQHEIISHYKFYLSFENNFHCKDYITEKLFRNALEYGALPVVWGGTREDYELVAPPNSYIFAEDFKTPEDLVNYLNYLDKNETAYRGYFLWRLMKLEDMPNYLRATRWCGLCKTIHGINNDQLFNPGYDSFNSKMPLYGHVESRTIPSLVDWYYGLENPECKV